MSDKQWTTHRWVTDEISHAIAYKLPVVEVREHGVDEQGGIAGDRQRILYDESERDKCLVEIIKTLGKWHQSSTVKLKLLPDEFVQDIRPFLRNPNLRCVYKTLDMNGTQSDEIPTSILPITGGLFIHAKNIPHTSLIQIHIECAGKSWTSNFENTDSFGIHLQQD